jgi:hypothetical protein
VLADLDAAFALMRLDMNDLLAIAPARGTRSVGLWRDADSGADSGLIGWCARHCALGRSVLVLRRANSEQWEQPPLHVGRARA